MRTYEWWASKEDVVKMLQWCKNNGKKATDYLKESFHLESPCHVVLRPIKEQV